MLNAAHVIDNERGKNLLLLARAAIAREFGKAVPTEENSSALNTAGLQEQGACFVTLTLDGELRGCVGSLEARRPLLIDIEANARAAALSDPRFEPLSASEFEKIEIEISLLSSLQSLQFAEEADALFQIRPGVDGIVFEYGSYRSTFLPQVWEQLPTPREFLAHLKVKARLPANFWASDVKLYRYTVTKYKESDFSFSARELQ